ncbi:unnamed protein product, partial [Ixodes pacificus]
QAIVFVLALKKRSSHGVFEHNASAQWQGLKSHTLVFIWRALYCTAHIPRHARRPSIIRGLYFPRTANIRYPMCWNMACTLGVAKKKTSYSIDVVFSRRWGSIRNKARAPCWHLATVASCPQKLWQAVRR